MKFIVDQTLGSLAKWLRLCGFDAVEARFDREAPAPLPPPRPQTCILTRQRRLSGRTTRQDVIVVTAAAVEAQLAEVLQRTRLEPAADQALSRCSHCNRPLTPVSHEAAGGRVPDYIHQQHRQFFECPQCGRLFWEGSHLRAIRQRLHRLRETMTSPDAASRPEGGGP